MMTCIGWQVLVKLVSLFAYIVCCAVCSDWKLIWSFKDPFYSNHPNFEDIKAMGPGQKVCSACNLDHKP